MKKQAKQDVEPYVKLENEMLESAAWTAISDKAIWIFIELKKQWTYKGGFDRLIMPYSKVLWRMSRATYFSKIKELIKYGFITREAGGLYRNPNVYALSDKWKQISREIENKEGREAIRSGAARKPSSKDNLKNLEGKRKWEKK